MTSLLLQVTALEKTLEQMIGSNMGFTKSFKPVNEKQAFEDRTLLREKLDRVYDRLKFKRNEERAIARDVEQASSRLELMAQEESKLSRAIEALDRRRIEAHNAVLVCVTLPMHQMFIDSALVNYMKALLAISIKM